MKPSRKHQEPLCATRDGGTWDFARDEKGDCPVKRTINMYTTCGSVNEALLREQELLQQLIGAEQGRLVLGSDVIVVERHPEIFELRWTKPTPFAGEERPVHFRMYFAEPTEEPGVMVGLVFHKKAIAGLTDQEIAQEQNDEIDHAVALLMLRRSNRKK